MFVPESGVTNGQSLDNIPEELILTERSRVNTYFNNEGPKSPSDHFHRDTLDILNEFSAYNIGFDYNYENPQQSFNNLFKPGETEALYEFSVFASGSLATIKERDPQGWQTNKYQAYRGVVKTLMEKSMNSMNAVYANNQYTHFRSNQITSGMHTWRTSDSPKVVNLRETLVEAYGQEWTDNFLRAGSSSVGVAAP